MQLGVLANSVTPFSLGAREFALLRTIVEARLGINMPGSKRRMLETRLVRRLLQLNITTAEEYCHYLQTDRGKQLELPQFLDIVTTNTTSFFRELPQLDFLRTDVLPSLLENVAAEGRPLRIWSAACSTGQEVWTLVMMIERLLEVSGLRVDFTVWGSDVSGCVLQTAIAAKYERSDLNEMDPYYSARFFMRAKDPKVSAVRIRPEYRRRAAFFHQNLMDDHYKLPQRVDIVFLRNTLIYFPREKQLTIVDRATRQLLSCGLFVVGLAESLNGFSKSLRHIGRSVYQHASKHESEH